LPVSGSQSLAAGKLLHCELETANWRLTTKNMPPRFTYWTIIAGGQPTAFRAATQDELLPTLRQLQSKHPDATMMWFARGKLWPSQEAATMALQMRREGRPPGDRRGPAWRPGGEHQDPRDRFKVPRDVKRQRFASRLRRDRLDPEEKNSKIGQRPDRPFRSKQGQPSDRPPLRQPSRGPDSRTGGFRGHPGRRGRPGGAPLRGKKGGGGGGRGSR
jgi:hypothetical protein